MFTVRWAESQMVALRGNVDFCGPVQIGAFGPNSMWLLLGSGARLIKAMQRDAMQKKERKKETKNDGRVDEWSGLNYLLKRESANANMALLARRSRSKRKQPIAAVFHSIRPLCP